MQRVIQLPLEIENLGATKSLLKLKLKSLQIPASTIEYFIQHKLDNFLLNCNEILPHLNPSDRDSIGTNTPTVNAQKFLTLFQALTTNGIQGLKELNQPLNFWCGVEGKIKALGTKGELSDAEIPAIEFMFAVTSSLQAIRKECTAHIILLNSFISRVYASHASAIVNVYLTSEKLSESPGFTAGNAFWEAELPMLMLLNQTKMIADIQIHLYDHVKKQWNNGVSIFSEAGRAIPIRRRNHYRLDSKELPTLFKTINMSQESRKAWELSHPRPTISYGKLQNIFFAWKNHTLKNKQECRENIVKNCM